MAKVFVTQVPSRLNKETGEWYPTADISRASDYGEVVVMFPPQAYRLASAPMVQAVREKLKGFTKDDFLLPMGDFILFSACACIAAAQTGGVIKFLKWDSRASDYFATELRV